MNKFYYYCLICILILLADGMKRPGLADEKASPNPTCTIKTSLGDIDVELFAQKAPKTVANFMELAEGTKEFTDPKTGKKVKRPFYDGLFFHRVIKDFMIQGGVHWETAREGPGIDLKTRSTPSVSVWIKSKRWTARASRIRSS